MIILRTRTFSDNTITRQRKLLNDILTDYVKKEKRSNKKKEIINKIKDIANDPRKLKKGLKVAGIGTLSAGTIIGGSAIVGKKLKKKTDSERSNKKIKDQIAGED